MKNLLVKLKLQILFCILLFCFSCNTNYYSNEDLIGLWSYDNNSKHNKHVENYRINSSEFSSFDIDNPKYWNIQFLLDGTFEQNVGIPRKGRYFIKKVSTDYYIQLVYSDGDIAEGGLRLEKPRKGNRKLFLDLHVINHFNDFKKTGVIFYN